MASKAAIGSMNAAARKSIDASVTAISQTLGIDERTPFARAFQRELNDARYLKSLAEWLENVANALVVAGSAIVQFDEDALRAEYASMKREDVLERAQQAGMDVKGSTSKTEAVDFLIERAKAQAVASESE